MVLKVTILLRRPGEEERQKNMEKSEDKVVGFSPASLFPTKKWEAVTQDKPLDAEKNPESPYHQRLGGQTKLWSPSRYIHVKRE